MAESVKREPRTYRSTLRADQARETRRRIREAADALFLEDGYVATSMDDIAEAAGVSRQTVFTAFGSKAKLLKEVFDVRLAGDDEPLSMEERPAAQRVLTSTDPEEAIRLHSRIVVESSTRVAPIWRLLAPAAESDPELSELLALYEEGRLHGIGRIVDVVADLGALRKGRTKKKAKEAVWLVTGPGPLSAALDRGWSLADLERWYTDCLVGLLLEPDASS